MEQEELMELICARYSEKIQLDLSNRNFKNIDFDSNFFRHSTFMGGNFRAAIFDDKNLFQCSFKYSDLRRASFKNANLFNVEFQSADLRGADLRGADLKGATFRYARLDCAKIDYQIQQDLIGKIAEKLLLVVESRKENWYRYPFTPSVMRIANKISAKAKKLTLMCGSDVATLLVFGEEAYSLFHGPEDKLTHWLKTKLVNKS